MSWPALSNGVEAAEGRHRARDRPLAVGLDTDVGGHNDGLGARGPAERRDLVELRGVARREREPGPPAPPAGELQGHLASDADRSAGEQHCLIRREDHRQNLALDARPGEIYPFIRI